MMNTLNIEKMNRREANARNWRDRAEWKRKTKKSVNNKKKLVEVVEALD